MRVFLSYSRRDDSIAKEVTDHLERAGHDVWRDTTSIPGGAGWREAIEDGIRSSDVFVMLLSPQVVESPQYPREELDFARSIELEIIPVYAQETTDLPKGFALTLGGRQAVKLFPSYERGIAALLDVLGTEADPAADPSPTLRSWAGGRAKKLQRASRRLRVEARQREVGPKVLKAAGVIAGAAVAAKVAADHARNAEVKRGIEKDQQDHEDARSRYVERVAVLVAGFTSEYERSGEGGVSAAEYQDEFRPRFWVLVGELKGLDPPTVELRDTHRRFVGELEESVKNLDEAFRLEGQGDTVRAQRALQRSYEKLWTTFKSFVDVLQASAE